MADDYKIIKYLPKCPFGCGRENIPVLLMGKGEFKLEIPRCKCMNENYIKDKEQQIINNYNKLISLSGIPNRYNEYTFDSYINKSNDNRNKKIVDVINQYIDNDKRGWLVLWGKKGTGKTFFSVEIVKRISKKFANRYGNIPFPLIIWVSYPTLVNNLNSYDFDTSIYYNVPVLIIDDFCDNLINDFKSSSGVAKVYNVLNHRHNNGKSLILSSNIIFPEVVKGNSNYSKESVEILDRLWSRCNEKGNMDIIFNGDDMRLM